MHTTTLTTTLLIITLILQLVRISTAYNVVVYELGGGGGEMDSTNSMWEAWSSACASTIPSTIYVPQGRFLQLRHLHFKGPCTNKAITFHLDGTLVAVHGNTAANWLLFEGADGVSIRGGGVLDGRGANLWACKTTNNGYGRSNYKYNSSCATGVTTLVISNTKNVTISGVTSLNSEMFHIVINGCENVMIQGVTILAPGNSPNTDGIHVQLSTGVTILNSEIGTGDDCISIGPGAKDLWIENVACGPGHGISIGSLGKDFEEAGVQNVTVKSVRFENTQNGVRIKTWGRASRGFVKDVVFQHAIMSNVQNPIVIDQNYCPFPFPTNVINCPGQISRSGVGISNVIYQDIQGTSATDVAVKLECSETSPCRGIRMENVNLTYQNHPARATCFNAGIAGGRGSC